MAETTIATERPLRPPQLGIVVFKSWICTLSDVAQWISWFLSSKGNEYFCEVEEDYILDRFNLTGLNTEVQHYAQALDMITDNLGTSPIAAVWIECPCPPK